MKRIILIAVWAMLLVGIQFIANCSNPLELTDTDDFDPVGPITYYDTVFSTDTLFIVDTTIDTIYSGDTLIVIDTIINNDTIYIEDTLIINDTITITDTLTFVDTVTIYEPEEGAYQTVCTILLANLREIIWMFDNEAGTYLFELTASQSREFDRYTLLIDIDGQGFEWKLIDGHEFSAEVTIGANSTINIRPKQPLLLGHQVDICLTVSKR